MNISNDPFIRELLPEFVDSWIDDIDTKFMQFIKAKDSGELYRLAHTLKGSCFQFGLDDIGKMGVELMELAKDEDWEKAATYEQPIRNSFARVKEYLESNSL
ncbi:MAG: Hpt domain-containing protein [Chloroflexota bacterium]